MIIGYPTALYDSVLPTSPTDPSYITWLISSTDPPRQKSSTMLVSLGIELMPLPQHTFNHSTKFPAGEYVFNLSYTGAAKVGLGNKLYESGQILEFEQDQMPEIVDTEAPETVDVQQNTNILNLSELGLTQEEISQLESASWAKFNDTISQMNIIRSNINSLTVNISDNQRLINEVRKAKAAAEVVCGSGGAIIKKLMDKENELINQRNNLINTVNMENAELNVLYGTLINIKEVVR